MAAKIVLEPIFEAAFHDCSHGFRPRRSATDALGKIRTVGNRGHYWVVDADIRNFFDSIDRDLLMNRVQRRISDRRVLKLLRKWLGVGVMEEGEVRKAVSGTPQGGVISPLLANVVLDALDEAWEQDFAHLGQLVRYADDFVVLCRTRPQAEAALARVREILGSLRLELHPEKTRVVRVGLGRKGFTFLGCHFQMVRSHFKGRLYLFRWPSPKAMNAIRSRIRELTNRQRRSGMRDVREVIEELNPILRGWGNYFRTGKASAKFHQIDRFVEQRLVRLVVRRSPQMKRRPFFHRKWPRTRFVREFGLHKLVGTIRYPGVSHAS